MSQEVLINVNITGEEEVNKLDSGIKKVGETTKKTTNAMTEMRKEIKQAKSDMLTYAEGTKEYIDAMNKAAAAQDRMREMTDKVKASQRDIGVVAKNVAGAVSGLAAGFATTQGIITLFGIENENTTKTLLKMQSVLTVTQGLANFVDAFDSMKDLFNAVKLRIIGMTVAKEADTVATTANTTAIGVETVAMNTLGTAAANTGKKMLASLGPYALIAAAIIGIIAVVIDLTKKLNEIPESVKIDLELNQNALKTIEKTRAGMLEIQHQQKLADDAKRRGDNETYNQITTNIEKVLDKNKWGNSEEYKLAKNKDLFLDKVFKNELERQRQLAYNADIFAKQAELRTEIADKKAEIAQITKLKGRTMTYTTQQPGGLATQGVTATMVRPAITNLENDIKKLEEKSNTYESLLLKTYKPLDTETVKKSLSTKTSTPYIKTDAELKKELSAEGINETNQKRKDELAFEIAHKNDTNPATKMEGKKLSGISITKKSDKDLQDELKQKGDALLETIQTMTDAEIAAFQAGEDASERHKEKIQKDIEDVSNIFGSLGNVMNSLSNIYQANMDTTNTYYDIEAERITSSMSDNNERKKALEKNEKDRYEALKKDFDKQKKAREATVWIDTASAIIGTWAGYASMGIPGTIAAGLQTAALLVNAEAQVKSIKAQKLDAPTSTSDTSSSSSSSTVNTALSALEPSSSSLTSKEENLNMISKNIGQQSVVLVSDINKVQSDVSVRESNSTY